jgi:flagellar hook-associated protein 3 FlgL
MRADPFFIQNTLVSLNQVQSSVQTYTEQLSSGVSVTALSDNPTAAAQDSLVASNISADATFTQTAATTEGMMQVTDSTLAAVVSQLTSAISTATAGNNGTLNSSDKAAITSQLEGIRSSIVGLANSSYMGVSIFAGSQGNVTAFTLDSSTSPATVIYNGDSVAQSVTTPTGASLQTSIPGDQIFGGGTGTSANVLGVLNNLINDFSTGTSAVADTAALTTSLNQLSSVRAQFDSSLQQLQSVDSYTQTQQVQLQAAESALVAANPAQIATNLSNAEVQQSALLSVMASSNKTDLFDYLR